MSDHLRDNDELLDPRLAELYAAEAATPLPAGCEQRVLAGVLARLAQAPLPIPAPAPEEAPLAQGATRMPAGKALMLALFSAIIGGLIGAAIERRQSGSAVPEELDAGATALEPLSPLVDAGAGRLARVEDASATPGDAPGDASARRASGVVRKAPAAEDAPDDLTPEAREAHLIDRARTALRRGLLDQALLALMQHERTFRTGLLAEERDVLAIETYLAKGELQIAKTRIERYRASYPQGFHRKRVDRIAEEMP